MKPQELHRERLRRVRKRVTWGSLAGFAAFLTLVAHHVVGVTSRMNSPAPTASISSQSESTNPNYFQNNSSSIGNQNSAALPLTQSNVS